MGSLAPRLAAGLVFTPHWLHDTDRCWPETNCYVDLWIEVLASLGEVPEAAFGYAVCQRFDEDQFTFSKLPIEDLRRLYGLVVQELSIYRPLEQHVALHVGRGEVVLMEVDAFYLPDTLSTTYRRSHAKTTIAVDAVDTQRQQAGYFHNAARGSLLEEDYLGALRLRPEFSSQPDILTPYVETVARQDAARDPGPSRVAALDILRGHLSRRPETNPFSAWRASFDRHLDTLLSAAVSFDDYAFHFPRLAGANFELLGSHVEWLAADALGDVAGACRRLAQTCKVVQFRLARALARRRSDPCGDCFDSLQADYEQVIGGLLGHLS